MGWSSDELDGCGGLREGSEARGSLSVRHQTKSDTKYACYKNKAKRIKNLDDPSPRGREKGKGGSCFRWVGGGDVRVVSERPPLAFPTSVRKGTLQVHGEVAARVRGS